jgi:hypothetical protein
MSQGDPAAIEADIEAQRERLAQTVDQLTHKLDVKAQAQERSAQLKDWATTETGKPRPELLGVLAGAVVLVGVVFWWSRR